MIQSLLQMRDTTPCPRCASGSAKCWAWTSPCRCRCCCARSRTRLRRRPHHLARPARLPGRAVRRPPHPRLRAVGPRGRRAVGDGPGRQGRRRHAALGQGGLFHRGLGNTGTTRKRLPGMPQPGRSRERGAEDGAGGRRHRQGRQPAGRQGLQPVRLRGPQEDPPAHGGLPGHAPGQVRPDALGRAHPRRGPAGLRRRRIDAAALRDAAASIRHFSRRHPRGSCRPPAPRSSRSANWYCPR